MSFRVDLEIYRGPLDLLLYLVRKHEIEVDDLPVAAIADQFLESLRPVAEADVDAAADFLDLASTLAEMKSRSVLPRTDESGEDEPLEDPRRDLVRRLLEYKSLRDAAHMLDEQGREWRRRFARQDNDLPPRRRDLAEEPIHELELWDLVSAFTRLMRDNAVTPAANIVYDETPIATHMTRIYTRLRREGPVPFSGLFRRGMHKSALVGVFLAMMELVRRHGVVCEQGELFDEIWLRAPEDGPEELNLDQTDNYEHAQEPQ